jgi:hypothetical protein
MSLEPALALVEPSPPIAVDPEVLGSERLPLLPIPVPAGSAALWVSILPISI